MAGPLAGLPWLLGGIASVAGGFIGHLSRDQLKKLVVISYVVAGVVVFIAAFFTLMISLVNSISASLPPYFSAAAGMVIPDNFLLIVSITMSAHVGRFIYEWNVKIIQYRLF